MIFIEAQDQTVRAFFVWCVDKTEIAQMCS